MENFVFFDKFFFDKKIISLQFILGGGCSASLSPRHDATAQVFAHDWVIVHRVS